MTGNPTDRVHSYSTSGVDEEREQLAFASVMRPWLLKTSTHNQERVRTLSGVRSGHFATVLQIDDGPAIALTTDGVGTKILVARAAERYMTVGIDCVANNVNDLVCIGAEPIALLDYIAINEADERVLAELAEGLFHGADEAGVSIPGGEIAQVGEMLAPADDERGAPMFDLVATAVGLLPQESPRPLDGSLVQPGDIVVGLRSSGLHSNGYSLARHVLFDVGHHGLDDLVPGTDRTLADVLLEPTRIYVKTMRDLREKAEVPVHGLVNISGGGMLNLLRLQSPVGYRIEQLPEPQPIFKMISETGKVPPEEMYATFNMGVGACVVVAPDLVDRALDSFRASGEDPIVIGEATDAFGGSIELESVGLRGMGDTLQVTGESARTR